MLIKRTSMAVCLLLAACNGGDDSEPTKAPEPTAYADMSFQQREVFMSAVVLPKMKEVFVAFDPKFSTMDCATCHGGGVADGSYAMPSSQIPALPATEEAFMEYVKDPEHARWSQFMLDDVWLPMADLLQVPAFDPATNPTGFSCSNCHTHTVEAAQD